MLKVKQIQNQNKSNFLAEGTIVIGNIKSKEDFRIDGNIEGNVICNGKIIIGVNGSVKGDIKCTTADISGKVTGRILSKEILILKSQAVFNGDAITKTAEIESGAIFNGTCKMNVDTNNLTTEENHTDSPE